MLEFGCGIKIAKKYTLINKIIILDLKNGFLFIAFSNSYLIINIGYVSVSKIFSLIKFIEKLVCI